MAIRWALLPIALLATACACTNTVSPAATARVQAIAPTVVKAAAARCGATDEVSLIAMPVGEAGGIAFAFASGTLVYGKPRQPSRHPAGGAQTSGCTWVLRVVPGREINAVNVGGSIVLSSALVDLSADAQLAFVIAHELAHDLLDHPPSAHGAQRQHLERAADELGLRLVLEAGYDGEIAIGLLERIAASYPRLNQPHPDYPTYSERYTALRNSLAARTTGALASVGETAVRASASLDTD